MKKITALQLQTTIIENNYCSGCGVCTATENSPFTITMNEFGQYIPQLNKKPENETVVCPFANHGLDENTIAKELFAEKNTSFHPDFGYYKNIYAGHVNQDEFRKNGSSGGSVLWLTHTLLKQNLVDYVIHVKDNNTTTIRYKYAVSKNGIENLKSSKSKYYPTSLEEALQFVKSTNARFALVGLPCFIKGINLLKKTEGIYKERIVFTIGIFCGHLKTTHYLSSLISQFKIEEKKVKYFDFRHKIEGRKASDYGTKLTLDDNSCLIKPNNELYGTNWGWGLFKLKACDYCDDIISETADISFGDAWTPKYENDYLGTNVIVTRNAVLDNLIKENINSNVLIYNNFTPNELIESQAGGFRHRREGLAYRLFLQQKKGNFTPTKRVLSKKIENKKRRKLYKVRMKLQERSFYTQNYQNTTKLRAELESLINKLESVYQHSAWTTFRIKLKKWLKK